MLKKKEMGIIKIGASASASWAWGTSLIMGQQIAQEKGIIAWVIWAVCNVLTLALFGWLTNTKRITPQIFNRKEVKAVALIIQLFCLLVQLNFINQQFAIITGNDLMAYLITCIIGIVFTLIVFNKGLPTSVKTDVGQWLGAIVSIAVIIGIGIYTDAPTRIFATTTGSGVLWGVWSGLILFAGPIGDVQHWQRAEADKSKKAYYLGSVLFALYMLEILGMAFFEFTPLMNTILLLAVLCVTTSTIDSIAVALHELGNKKVGTGMAILLCLSFGLFVEMGMIQLWSSFGVIRYVFAIAILLLPLCLKGKAKITIPIIAITAVSIVVFSILGQITVNSIAGVISITISAVMLGYLIYMTFKKR